MKLNIYLMSHPIIQKIANDLIHKQNINTYYNHKNNYSQLGFLIMYEILRKSLLINRIYIKKVNHTKEICTFSNKKSYLIITDLIKWHQIVNKAVNLFPQVTLQHFSLDKYENSSNNINISNVIKKINNQNTEIFIIELHLINYSIITILDKLILTNNTQSHLIKIVCITCCNNILNKIGKKYPNINIYTTKIITN